MSILGGGSISYLLSSRGVANTQAQGEISIDTENDYKNYDATLDIGLMLETKIDKNISIQGTALYSFGIVEISTLGSNEKTSDVKLMVGCSYLLNR